MLKRKSIAIIGGGFFGLSAAVHIAEKGHKVTIFERNSKVMQEASLFNQARVHGGYHYPRSLTTAARCRANYSQFLKDFQSAIVEDFESIYAIASDSKVNFIKFTRLMEMIGAPIEKLSGAHLKEFNSSLISQVYRTREVSFNSSILSSLIVQKLNYLGVQINFNAEVVSIANVEMSGNSRVVLHTQQGDEAQFDGVIITTYGLDDIQMDEDHRANYVYEACELIRVQTPEHLKKVAITVVDGPYWSLTPWPAFGSHIITHVRFTPHARFNHYLAAKEFLKETLNSRSDLVIRDAARYMPVLSETEVLGSEYIIKTILKKRDFNDSRPIFIQQNKRILTVLGSKIDTIYDVQEIYNNFIEVI